MGCASSKEEDAMGNVSNSNISKNEKRRSSAYSVGSSKAEIDARIDAIKTVQTGNLGGAQSRFAYVSQRGYYPDDLNKANQDAYSLTEIGDDYLLAVYDGHGRQGDYCSQFAKRFLPEYFSKYLEKERQGAKNNPESPHLTKEQVQKASFKAHMKCNMDLHKTTVIDDSLSGTTAISVFFHGPGNRITISNCGDSRAVLGKINENQTSYRALPLSRDHTPYRLDERRRVIKAGARVLSLDQLEGVEPVPPDDFDQELNLGEEIDESGDPPRIWSPDGEYPGTAFTRSIGDEVAEQFGVFAEAEMITKELSEDDKIIVIASDGVFEFLTNQSVIDICAKFQDPLEACRAIVAESYELWLQYELRTDDITIICVFIDNLINAPSTSIDLESSFKRSFKRTISFKFKEPKKDELDEDHQLVEKGIRPVRQGVSKSLGNRIKQTGDGEQLEDIDITQYVVAKSDNEKGRIRECLRGNRTFQNISSVQMEALYDTVKKVVVTKGTWIIKQGTVGENYYIVDHGKFEVRVLKEEGVTTPKSIDDPENAGKVVHVYEGGDNHPSFGEIALVHSIPRAASVLAKTDGQLWALSREQFAKIIMARSDRRGLQKVMQRKVHAFSCLETSEIERLANNVEEIMFQPEDVIVKKGDIGDTFYFIVHGRCIRKEENLEIKENGYFGDEVIVGEDVPYISTVVASTTTKCFYLTLDMIEKHLHMDLQMKMEMKAEMQKGLNEVKE